MENGWSSNGFGYLALLFRDLDLLVAARHAALIPHCTQ
jgi:hypothetical protein